MSSMGMNYVSTDLTPLVCDSKSGAIPAKGFRRGWHLPQPSFFMKRAVYEALGGFRTELRIAADYEFMLRVLERY